jgi:hypothetical protein
VCGFPPNRGEKKRKEGGKKKRRWLCRFLQLGGGGKKTPKFEKVGVVVVKRPANSPHFRPSTDSPSCFSCLCVFCLFSLALPFIWAFKQKEHNGMRGTVKKKRTNEREKGPKHWTVFASPFFSCAKVLLRAFYVLEESASLSPLFVVCSGRI